MRQLTWQNPREKSRPIVFLVLSVMMLVVAVARRKVGALIGAAAIAGAGAFSYWYLRRWIDVFGDDAGLLLTKDSGDSERVPWTDVESFARDGAGCILRFRRQTLAGRTIRLNPPGPLRWTSQGSEHPDVTWVRERLDRTRSPHPVPETN
jgi:hypothetical protein